MASSISAHERALNLLFDELAASAAARAELFLGSPGTLAQRANDNGTTYWVHRYSDALGRRRETYLGVVGERDTEDRVESISERIAAANAAVAQVRILARAGFATVDRKSYATIASLHNHGIFRAGAVLVGSHAYGALLNALGVRAQPYATEDVDVARPHSLQLAAPKPLLEVLRATGIPYFEVPALGRGEPSTSFAERGASRLRVDLLVPFRDDSYPIVPVPELEAHGRGLPFLAYLLSTPQSVPLLSPHGVVDVRVPTPERFAIHKLIVSQLRARTSTKPQKDLHQAATLIEAVAERYPGALEDALRAVPRSAGRYLKRAVAALRMHLPAERDLAWAALERQR